MPAENFYCPQCGYNLRAIPEDRCPECGFGYDRDGIESLSMVEATDSLEGSREVIVYSSLSILLAACPLSHLYSLIVICTFAPVTMVLIYYFTKATAPRLFDPTFFRFWLLLAIPFFIVPTGLMLPGVALIGATCFGLWGWFLCLRCRQPTVYSIQNLPVSVQRRLRRDSVLALVVLLAATMMTALCAV